jgi:arylsulfatase A-like enzyme
MTDDTKLHLVEGPSIATIDDTGNGIVHFSTEGAARVATNVVSIMDPVINPPFVPQTSQTNIVMIVIDDLGWMDLSIQGSQFYETPRIDALAASGMRFTQGYAAHPRCLPSRYGLMTGRFPGANGVPGGPENNLRPSETTIAEALQANGYETAFMGKWHLVGTHGEANLPQNQGFDINISGGKPGAPKTYFHPYATDGTPTTNYELDTGNELYFDNATPAGGMVTDRITGSSYLRTAARGLAGEYVTDRLTDEALDWMDWNADKPMFLCLWHYGVHTPFEAPAALVSKYTTKLATMDYGNLPEEINVGVGQQKMRQNHPTYAAMIESVDTNIGRLMDKVAELGLSSNTVFIFTSDNGGLSNRGGNNNRTLATANYPLRTGKGWLYEGGIREAFIVSGAGVAAMVNSNAVVTGTDIYPTLLDLAGLPLQPDNHLDGVSFKMALDGSAYDRGEPIFWHSPQARPYSTGDFNSSAVRDGDYKLIWFYDTPGQPYELYNVKTDIGENNDLSESMPAKAAELLGKIQAWHAGAHDGSGVVFRPDADDVSKPPQTWLDDPTVPLSLIPGSADLDISWGDYLGFNYNVYSKTNLSDAAWTLEKSGITASETMLPMVGNSGFYKVESVLQPES